MDKWAKLFTGLAIVLFAVTIARSCYLDRRADRAPCDVLAAAGAAGDAAPAVVGYAPKQVALGAPLCLAITGADKAALDKDGKPVLHLFLDGMELKAAIGRLVDRQKNLVLFDLARSPDDADVWRKIIGQPGWGANGVGAGSIRLRVGAGLDTGEYDHAAGAFVEMRIVDPWALLLGIAAFLAAIAGLACAAPGSSILRDGNASSTYSLGRVQMAFWLYLVTAAFIYIWLVTGDYNGILTSQALTLLGISGSTALMANAVDQGTPAGSVGFWTDILSESGGVALHRLQIVAWTVILGVVFLAEIYNSFRLPTFDSNLLILMGISGVTYVGFKFNEK